MTEPHKHLKGLGVRDQRKHDIYGWSESETEVIHTAAGFLAATAEKAKAAFRALVAADIPSHDNSHHDNRSRFIYIPAGQFTLRAGTPALAARGASVLYDAWDFDAASSESVVTTVFAPADYVAAAIAVQLEWTNLGADTGHDVVWLVQIDDNADGDNIETATGSANTSATIAAPNQNVLKRSTVSPTFTPSASKPLWNIVVQRTGGDAADTLTNDAGLIGVVITYTGDN